MAGLSCATVSLVFTAEGTRVRVEFLPNGEWPKRRPLTAFETPYPDDLSSPVPAIARALHVAAEALDEMGEGR